MKTCRMLSVLIPCYCVSVGLAVGQDGSQVTRHSSAAAAKPVTAQVLQIFTLKHASAEQVLPIAQGLLIKVSDRSGQPTRFAVDARKNSLIVYGDQEMLAGVKALLLDLDKPDSHPERPEPQLTIIKLYHANPHEVLRAMEELSLKGVVAKYADDRTKTLFVRGGDEALAQLKIVVDQLDVASPAPKPRANVSLRIVWLVDKSLAGGDAAPVPNDLNGPIEKLRKQVDIGELRMATQMLVTINPGEETQFHSAATAKLKQLVDLSFTGVVTQNKQGENQLHVQLNANEKIRPHQICSLSTTCSGVFQGQPVIVGMTTVDSQPSVFVIEVLPN